MYTECPLCKSALEEWDNVLYFTMGCVVCSYDGMAKFQATYKKDSKQLIGMIWWIDDFYIRIDYENESTVVYRIDVCMLLDPVPLPGILYVDHNDPWKTARRLKTLMVFS